MKVKILPIHLFLDTTSIRVYNYWDSIFVVNYNIQLCQIDIEHYPVYEVKWLFFKGVWTK